MDYKFCCVVNFKLQYVRLVLVLLPKGEEPQIQGYSLADGESLVDAAPPIIRAHAGSAGFIKPKWDFDTLVWVEGATAEEIAAWETEHPAPEVPPPSQLDSIEAQSTYTAMMTDTLLEG